MDSWVKGSPAAEAIQPIGTVDSHIPIAVDGAPLDLIRFFGIDTREMDNQTRDRIKDIYKFSNHSDRSMGDILQELRNIESRMGITNEPRPSRMWNYLRIQNTITDLVKQRDSLLRY